MGRLLRGTRLIAGEGRPRFRRPFARGFDHESVTSRPSRHCQALHVLRSVRLCVCPRKLQGSVSLDMSAPPNA